MDTLIRTIRTAIKTFFIGMAVIVIITAFVGCASSRYKVTVNAGYASPHIPSVGTFTAGTTVCEK